jgi:hypothetical protein
MEQLRKRVDRFRKQGRLQDQEMEEIIQDIKEETEQGNSGDIAAKDKHKCVMDAVKEGLLQVHRVAPNTKQQGIFRLMGENCNRLNNRSAGNNKIAKALDIKEELDVDCLLYYKHRLNFKHKDNKNNLRQMFLQELACTVVSAHNIHEGKVAGQVQEGGTGIICFGETTGYIKKTGRDSGGLGYRRILFSGVQGHNAQIITAYNPCKNTNANSCTTNQQQRRYFITKKKDLTCPRVLFRNQLTKQIQE